MPSLEEAYAVKCKGVRVRRSLASPGAPPSPTHTQQAQTATGLAIQGMTNYRSKLWGRKLLMKRTARNAFSRLKTHKGD